MKGPYERGRTDVPRAVGPGMPLATPRLAPYMSPQPSPDSPDLRSNTRTHTRTRMPLAVYILGLSVFALGTSEFMLSGILPAVADDMDVTIPQAGLLISAFAIGMVVGAPLLAVATLRLPRRTTLISLITVFGLGQVAG